MSLYSDFIQGIERGVTPNPDVVCNQRIKFGVLQKHVFKKMGVSFLATGHYARVNRLSDGTCICSVNNCVYVVC